jgi:hypothetical protein
MAARTYFVMKSDGTESFTTAEAAQARAVEWVTAHPTETAQLAEVTADVYIPPQLPVVEPTTVG